MDVDYCTKYLSSQSIWIDTLLAGYNIDSFERFNCFDLIINFVISLHEALFNCKCKMKIKYNKKYVKGTNRLNKRHVRSPMLNSTLNLSDYRNFWNNERWQLYAKYSKYHCLFHMQNLFQNSANDISKMVIIIYIVFVKKIQILCTSDHPILFNFASLW